MASQPQLNYLLTHRKRSALSQEEVAFLLGAQSGAKVCRYERFLREPSLQTALALEVIFDRPVAELFPELFAEIEAGVMDRAVEMQEKEFTGKSSGLIARKRQTLESITSREDNDQLNQS